MPELVAPRLRLRYTKTGRIRYTSQRDVARAFERALRRARLPIAYSEGFSPRPLLAFSLALPTACESLAEYADLRFDPRSETPAGVRVGARTTEHERVSIGRLLGSLLPDGLEVTGVGELDGAETSLQEQVTSCSWIVEVTGMSAVELDERIAAVLDAETVPVERVRKGKKVADDLRPSLLSLRHDGPGSSPQALRISAELATKPRGVRPSELLDAMAPTLRLIRACRVAQWTVDHDGQRREPLTADGVLLGAVDAATVGGL